MKNSIVALLMGFILLSCGGGGSDDSPPKPIETVNKEPSTPSLIEPENNKLCINNSVGFKWYAAIDPENDQLTYQLQIATDNQFTQIIQTLHSEATNQLVALDKGKAYYWRVRATDSKNASSSYSSTFNFYTEGVGTINHIPFSPTLVAPVASSTIKTATATLQWNASDVDATDILTYDVYLGNTNPPTTKVAENQSTKLYLANLSASETYYWKVAVKDGKGGVTIGQVWSFKTD